MAPQSNGDPAEGGGGAVFAALFLAGAAGLAFEVAWQRHLTVLVGSDHGAAAATLAVFLGGLSAGYALCGRLSARVVRPLRAYVVLEVGIGVWGLLFPLLFGAVARLADGWGFRPPWGLALQSLACAIPLILPPALAMGATVPFMTRVLAADRATLTGTHARVYAVNTAGAVAGALGAGLGLLPAFGPDATVRIAAGGSLLAAGLLAVRFRSADPPPPKRIGRVPLPAPDDSAPSASRSAPPPLSAAVCALLAFGAGAVTLLQETVLLRLLAPAIGATPYVFSLVVAAFVAAIAIGSQAVSRMDRIGHGAAAVSCALAAAGWLALYPTFDAWPWAAHAIRAAGIGAGPATYLAAVWLPLAAVVAVAAAPLGAVLPIVFHQRARDVRTSGATAGALLGWNALGCLLGSVGGILLYEILALDRMLLVGPCALALLALLASRRASRALRVATATLTVAALAFAVLTPGFRSERLAIGTFLLRRATTATWHGPAALTEELLGRGRVTARRDGPSASAAVVRYPGSATLYVNGRAESNTRLDRETLRLSAHLPMLLAERPRRALVVGLGTGVTVGELARWDVLESIEAVEISSAVVDLLPEFSPETGAVQRDPRLTIRREDARNRVQRCNGDRDLIVAEASNPWIAGMDLFFSVEWFRQVERCLADGGVLLQWVQLYDTNERNLCAKLQALSEVFPSLRAFRGHPSDWLIVAAREPSSRTLDIRDAPSAVRASLAEMGLDAQDSLAGREIRLLPFLLDRYRSACLPHRARETTLAYRAAEAMYRGTSLFEPDLFTAPARPSQVSPESQSVPSVVPRVSEIQTAQ